MPISNLRQGAAVRIAAKIQAAQGTPVAAGGWLDADIMRADDAPAPDPQVEIISQTGTHGSPYERDEGVRLVGIEPIIAATLKVNPETVALLMKSLLGVSGVADGVGPVVGNPVTKYEGFAYGVNNWITYLYDNQFEALRASDVFIHTVNFKSIPSENLVVDINGIGFLLEKLAPQLVAQKLVNWDTYAHKDSVLEDVIGGTPISVLAIEQSLQIEHARISTRANAIAPNFVGKDGMITVTGSITTRLYDDTTDWMTRILALTRSNIKYRYFQQDGKMLEFVIRNATMGPTTYPPRNADGSLGNFVIPFTARQKYSGVPVEWPITIRVED